MAKSTVVFNPETDKAHKLYTQIGENAATLGLAIHKDKTIFDKLKNQTDTLSLAEFSNLVKAQTKNFTEKDIEDHRTALQRFYQTDFMQVMDETRAYFSKFADRILGEQAAQAQEKAQSLANQLLANGENLIPEAIPGAPTLDITAPVESSAEVYQPAPGQSATAATQGTPKKRGSDKYKSLFNLMPMSAGNTLVKTLIGS